MAGIAIGGVVALASAMMVVPTYRASTTVEFVELPGNLPLSDAARDARIDGVVESARGLPIAASVLADRRIAGESSLVAEARRKGDGAEALALALIDRLHAERIGATTLIRLEASAADPAIAARIAGAAADALIRRSLADRIATVAPVDAALDRDLAAARRRAEHGDAALAAFRAQFDLSGPPGAPLDPAEVVALRAGTTTARGEAAAASERASAAARHTIVSAASIGQNGTSGLGQLRVQRAEVARRLAQLDQAFTPEYPPYAAAEAELAALDRAIGSELDGLAGSASADASAAQSRAATLSLGLADAERRRARSLQAEADYARLQREADAAREAYRLLQQGLLQRTAERSLARPELRLVVPASLPLDQASPNRLLLLAFGTLAFGLAGVLLGLWSERRRVGTLRIEI